ncbi:MAG: hypothetical protein DMG24_04315 [Acidobacteria bacterium]|nr:MAG: hypothetical protein DMG24_04315 [Acidobacteriota bacterium]
MDQEKRLLLAFVLSFAVLMLWRALFPPPPLPQNALPAKAKTNPVQQAPAPAAPSPAPVSLSIEQGSKEEEIVIEGDLYQVTLSTQGAVVKSWVLKKYLDENDRPLDVVNGLACQALGFPMSLVVSSANGGMPDRALSAKLNSALYVTEPSGTSLRAPVKVDLTYSDGTVQARKQFTFGKGYEVRVETSVFDGQHYLPIGAAWPGGFGDSSLTMKEREARSRAVYAPPGEKAVVVPQTKVSEDRIIPGPFAFAGLEDRFFVAIFFPTSPDLVAFGINRQTWTPPDWKEKELPKPLGAMLGNAQPKPLDFRLFVAPKDLDVLQTARPPLDGLVDFGWFTIVARPLFLALRYAYHHWIHNWGWAIVTLTLLINLGMFPLKLKSIRSAQEMQRVAPLVKSIQDKYKQYKFNDPRKQRMNEEVMKLYKEHNINPLGGCLPMVLQLPILYGFYRVLDLAIELRHAPWMWIKDLSAPDRTHLFGLPLPILPTAIIITTFILQRMTPVATADPSQQRMMMIMPIFFGFIFFSLAAGLNLYYMTANIVGIAQQMLLNRMVPRTPPPPPPSGRAKPQLRNGVSVNR